MPYELELICPGMSIGQLAAIRIVRAWYGNCIAASVFFV
jgi:hypothetical protein